MVGVDPRPQWLQLTQPFVAGGFAGSVAQACVQPMDMVKTRIQLVGETPGASKSPIKVAGGIIRSDGVVGLYKGLDAGIARQLLYTTTRMGVFRLTVNSLKAHPDDKLAPWKSACAGLFAGAVGGFVGTPADLSLVRMQSDALLPDAQKRNYRGVLNAFRTIVREEGVTSLWRGSMPTIARASALNMAMLATFDYNKAYFSDWYGSPGMKATLTASACSAAASTTVSLPFDFAKTRIQKQVANPDGTLPYRNTVHCFVKVFRTEGPLAFYSGFPAYYCRCAPHAMLVLIITDRLDIFSRGLFAAK